MCHKRREHTAGTVDRCTRLSCRIQVSERILSIESLFVLPAVSRSRIWTSMLNDFCPTRSKSRMKCAPSNSGKIDPRAVDVTTRSGLSAWSRDRNMSATAPLPCPRGLLVVVFHSGNRVIISVTCCSCHAPSREIYGASYPTGTSVAFLRLARSSRSENAHAVGVPTRALRRMAVGAKKGIRRCSTSYLSLLSEKPGQERCRAGKRTYLRSESTFRAGKLESRKIWEGRGGDMVSCPCSAVIPLMVAIALDKRRGSVEQIADGSVWCIMQLGTRHASAVSRPSTVASITRAPNLIPFHDARRRDGPRSSCQHPRRTSCPVMKSTMATAMMTASTSGDSRGSGNMTSEEQKGPNGRRVEQDETEFGIQPSLYQVRSTPRRAPGLVQVVLEWFVSGSEWF